MKVEKIIIKKEIIDLPDDRNRQIYHVFSPPPISRAVRLGEEMGEVTVTEHQEVYEVRRIVGYRGAKVNKKYLVKIDDREVFDDLEIISRDDMQGLINQALEKERENCKETLILELGALKRFIKCLPWWRRLFKKF